MTKLLQNAKIISDKMNDGEDWITELYKFVSHGT